MPHPRNYTELAIAAKACSRCTSATYCHYHSAVNMQIVADEGRRQIQAMLSRMKPESRPEWAHHFEPLNNLTLPEKLVASIAVAKYRKENAA